MLSIKPHMKLHPSFVPVVKNNTKWVRAGAPCILQNLAFARMILERYSGFVLYDFDVSALLFLETVLRQQQQRQQLQTSVAQVRTSIHVCRVYQQQTHWHNWYITYQMYQYRLLLLEEAGRIAPAFAEQNHGKAVSTFHQDPLYITSSLFQRTVQHLRDELSIPPASQRLRRDFRQQMHLWQQLQQWYTQNFHASQNILPYHAVQPMLLQVRTQTASEMSKRETKWNNPWAQLYHNLMQLTANLSLQENDVEENSVIDSLSQQWSTVPWEQMEEMLEETIQERELLWGLFQQAISQWQQPENEVTKQMEPYEWQKLCLMNVIRTYLAQHPHKKRANQQVRDEYRSLWLNDLVYRMQEYDQPAWEAWVQQLHRTQKNVEQLRTVQQYVRDQRMEQTQKGTEFLPQWLQQPQAQLFSLWIDAYEKMVQRHSLVRQAFLRYEALAKSLHPLEFQQRKQLLLEQLQQCRMQHPPLFETIQIPLQSDVSQNGDAWKEVLHHVKYLQQDMIHFEQLTSQQLHQIQHSDAVAWDSLMTQLREWYTETPKTQQAVETMEQTVQMLHRTVRFQNAWEDLKKMLQHVDIHQLKTLWQQQPEVLQSDHAAWLFRLLDSHTSDHAERSFAPLRAQQKAYLLRQIRECLNLMEEMHTSSSHLTKQEQSKQLRVIRTITQQIVYTEMQEREEMHQMRIRRRWQFETEQWQQRCTTLAYLLARLYQSRRAGLWQPGSESEKREFLEQLRQQELLHRGVWNVTAWRQWHSQMLDSSWGRQLLSLFPFPDTAIQREVIELFTERGQTAISAMNQQEWVQWLAHISQYPMEQPSLEVSQQEIQNIVQAVRQIVQMQRKKQRKPWRSMQQNTASLTMQFLHSHEEQPMQFYQQVETQMIYFQRDIQHAVTQQRTQQADFYVQRETQQKNMLQLKKMLEEQEQEVSKLNRIQQEYQQRLKEQEEQLKTLKNSEMGSWEQMTERLHHELRLERLRKGLQ